MKDFFTKGDCWSEPKVTYTVNEVGATESNLFLFNFKDERNDNKWLWKRIDTLVFEIT